MKQWIWWGFICLLVSLPLSARAQEDEALTIRLRRDFGSSLGAGIQGRFSILVDAPDNVRSVAFYIDDTLLGEDTEAPFRLQFHTDNYPQGSHAIYAVGITDDSRQLTSNRLSRNFLSGSSANRAILWIIIPLVVLAVGGRIISNWVANRKTGRRSTAVSGPSGGTICPNCQKPYALHFWKLNLVIGAFDRCPHCGKWRLVRRVHPEQLQAAAEAMEAAATQTTDAPSSKEAEDIKKRLDHSRFDSF